MSVVPYRPALILCTFVAFALRVWTLSHQSFWLDEVDAISMASEPLAVQLRKLTAVGENGPLYFLLYKGWIWLAGSTEFGARFLSCLASTLAIPLIAALTRQLTRQPGCALIAAALAAASPYYLWYGQDGKMYALLASLALGAQLCLVRAFAIGHQRWWVGYVVASSLALYTHLFAALLIASNTAAGLVFAWRRWRASHTSRVSWGFIASTIALTLPYVPVALWQAPVLLRGTNVGYRPVGVPHMLVTLAQQFTWRPPQEIDSRLTLIVLAIVALGFWRLTIARPRTAITIALWFGIPLLGVYALQFTVPVFRDRYLIFLAAPLFIVFASATGGRTALPVSVSAATFLVLSWGYGLTHRPSNPNFRAAAALVRESIRPGERVGFLAEYSERPFAYYYRQTPPFYEKVALPYTNYPGMSEQDGLTAVATGLRGGERLWIVRFEDWLWDGRDLATQFLRSRGAVRVSYQDFDGVSVSEWQLP